MTKILLAGAAMMALATPSFAITAKEICTTIADDGAYIMGVRQRGEKMVNVLDHINWMKYQDTPVEGLEIEMAGWAWREPIATTPIGRRAQVSNFSANVYAGCMKAMTR